MAHYTFQFRTVAWLTVMLPLTGFIVCVGWSLLYDFKSATATHCGVHNYLPSVSAAIGDLPQRNIWRFVIALHTFPRVQIAFVYHSYFSSIIAKWASALVLTNLSLNLVEITSLFGLTFIASTDNYTIHKVFFITFLLTSTVYMMLSLYLLSCHRVTTPSALEAKSFRYKKRLLMTTLFSIVGSMYFFARHNSYCEPLMYTWFAVCEYSVILCNMAFHMTSYWDFPNREWTFGSVRPHRSLIGTQQLRQPPFRV